MFYTGWLSRGEQILVSVIILGINILFNIYAFSIIFKTTIEEFFEEYKRSKLAKSKSKQKADNTKVLTMEIGETKSQIEGRKVSPTKVMPSQNLAQDIAATGDPRRKAKQFWGH